MKIKFYLTGGLLLIQISSFSFTNISLSETTSETVMSKCYFDKISSIKNIIERTNKNLKSYFDFTSTLKCSTNKLLHRGILTIRENENNKFILICKSKGLTIRVDQFKDSYRYCAWNKGKSITSMPDLIIYDGVVEKQGTMGGYTWTFKNKEWTYVIDEIDLCDTAPECGIFFELYLNDKLYKKQKMTKIK